MNNVLKMEIESIASDPEYWYDYNNSKETSFEFVLNHLKRDKDFRECFINDFKHDIKLIGDDADMQDLSNDLRNAIKYLENL